MDDGFNDLINKLEHAQHELESMSGTHDYKWSELFPDSFMKEHTKSASIDSFFSDLGVTDKESFDALPQKNLEKKVKSETDFESWRAMNEKATAELVLRRTGLS